MNNSISVLGDVNKWQTSNYFITDSKKDSHH